MASVQRGQTAMRTASTARITRCGSQRRPKEARGERSLRRVAANVSGMPRASRSPAVKKRCLLLKMAMSKHAHAAQAHTRGAGKRRNAAAALCRTDSSEVMRMPSTFVARRVTRKRKGKTLTDHAGWRRFGDNSISGGHMKSKASAQAKQTAPASRLIDERIEELNDWRGETLSKLRGLIKKADPKVVEEWKWEVPVWSHDGIICTGESYKSVVKLTFAQGAKLKDPKQLFNSSLAGNTRRAIDFREGEKID